MLPLEIEVKFYLSDIKSLRNRIISSGAKYTGKHFEHNILFENSSKSFMKKKMLLRLRQDSKAKLTFKCPPDGPQSKSDKQFKILNEMEVEVSDFLTMKQILNMIGFHPEQIYEKWRETFILGNTKLCLDLMPFGNFLEIEGVKDDIIHIAKNLDIQWEKRILANYLGLFNYLKQELNLPFSDITFDNFKSVNKDIINFFTCFEAWNMT